MHKKKKDISSVPSIFNSWTLSKNLSGDVGSKTPDLLLFLYYFYNIKLKMNMEK